MRKGKLRYPTSTLLARYTNLTAAEVAEQFGVNRATIQRWRNPKSTFNQWNADRYAVRIGLHPGNIWPDWFDINC